MHTWKHESIFAEYIRDEDLFVGTYSPRRPSLEAGDRNAILSNTVQAVQRLQRFVVGHDAESYWIEQLLQYIQRLHMSTPAQSPDEQYSHLYLLRKWLFFVPILLLQKQGGQGPAMLVLSHFYATALALEPLYPDLGSAFCARIALSPLEQIIGVTDAMQSQRALDQNSMEIAALMQFPQQIAASFKARLAQSQQMAIHHAPTMPAVNPETFNYTSIGNLSPAFTPSPLHRAATSTPSSNASYLGVPSVPSVPSQHGFDYGTAGWGMGSPAFPAQTYSGEDEQQMYQYSLGSFRGFVATPSPIWT